MLESCRHLGSPSQAMRPCLDGCKKKPGGRDTLIRVYNCLHPLGSHPDCTPARHVEDAQCCLDCPDRDPPIVKKGCCGQL